MGWFPFPSQTPRTASNLLSGTRLKVFVSSILSQWKPAHGLTCPRVSAGLHVKCQNLLFCCRSWAQAGRVVGLTSCFTPYKCTVSALHRASEKPDVSPWIFMVAQLLPWIIHPAQHCLPISKAAQARSRTERLTPPLPGSPSARSRQMGSHTPCLDHPVTDNKTHFVGIFYNKPLLL